MKTDCGFPFGRGFVTDAIQPPLLMHDASSSKELVAEEERNEGIRLSRRLDAPM